MQKSVITTHILDTAVGLPAANVPVTLYQLQGAIWHELAKSETDTDGRIMQWSVDDAALPYGTYKLHFDIVSYAGDTSFYPFAEIVFQRRDERHHHIPLLLTPFGYSTYRGS